MIIEWMHDINRRLRHLERLVMSDISNEAQLEQDIADLGAAQDATAAHIAELDAKIAQGGVVTSDDLAKLGTLLSKERSFVSTDTPPATSDTGSTTGDVSEPTTDQTQADEAAPVQPQDAGQTPQE